MKIAERPVDQKLLIESAHPWVAFLTLEEIGAIQKVVKRIYSVAIPSPSINGLPP